MSKHRPANDASDTVVASRAELEELLSDGLENASKATLRPPELNQKVGHFELLSFLGRGGMGEVYKAHDTRLDRIVALKLLLPSADAVERFQREARAQAKIEHEAVCSVFEVGIADGRSFIAMQYLEGTTLGEGASELTLEEKVLVIRQVAEAIHVAHTQALVHRDLKPGNVMIQTVGSSLKAWVLDFGMVHATGDAPLTTTGEVLGSPCYMAPEQINGEIGAIDRRTDVYGLGAIFYQILVDRPPFEGNNVVDVIRKAVTEEPLAPRQLRPQIPEDLEWIVLRCLEKEPRRRYGSASALIEDLDRFRRGEPVLARRSSWRYRSTKWLSRHRRALAAAAAVLTLVVGLVWRDLAQRQEASETARLTAHFLREKKELEWRLRTISMLPLHNTRPERVRLLETLSRLEDKVYAAGKVGKGPGFFALGRGFQVLGVKAKALRYLEQSWHLGFRDPRLSFGLGLAYSELYDESQARLSLQPDPKLRQQQRREAEARYRNPAIERLQEAGQGRQEDLEWVAARVAAHERRWDAAFAAIEKVEKSSPWFYETHGLEALIWHSQALEATDDPEKARELLDRAEAALTRAIRIGASDPAMYIKLCYQRQTRITVFQEPLPTSLQDCWQLMTPCQQAIQSDSGSAEAHAMAALMAASLGKALLHRDRDRESVIFFEEAARLAEQALALDSNQILALKELAGAHLRLAAVAVPQGQRENHLGSAYEAARSLKELDPLTGASLYSQVAIARAEFRGRG